MGLDAQWCKLACFHLTRMMFVLNEGVSEFCVPQINVFFPQIKVAYKKDAKENLHYTTVADRPDIKKATQAAKQASEVRVP